MTIPQTHITNPQKLSDIYDVFDPALDTIIRNELQSKPFANRRQWEFSIIYLALHQGGFLNSNSSGLAVGAGTEQLIYAIAPKVKKATITDLYGMDGGWAGLDVPDPHSLIMEKAPWSIDPDKIEALPMDMRYLKFPDESFDFCWSTGAIEHIGEDADFVQHFNEVWRVLKPGGMYALTTACILGEKTARIRHNYYFEPQHLLDLAHESRLQAEPIFDCQIREHTLNDAKAERLDIFGYPAGNSTTPLVAFRRGCLVVGNSLILRKSQAPKVRPVTKGLDETIKLAQKSKMYLNERTWKNWQLLNLEPQGNSARCQPQWFGNSEVEMQLLGKPGHVKLFSRSRVSSSPTLVLETDDAYFRFKSNEELLYIVRIKEVDPEQTVLRARHAK